MNAPTPDSNGPDSKQPNSTRLGKHLGKHSRVVDSKGRVALPASFRESFDELAYLAKAPGDSCVAVYLPQDFERAIERLEALLREGEASQNEYRQFTASVVEVAFDAQGRFMLPKELRAAAELEGKVVVVGVGSRIEIWNQTQWAAVEADPTPLQGERWL